MNGWMDVICLLIVISHQTAMPRRPVHTHTASVAFKPTTLQATVLPSESTFPALVHQTQNILLYDT